MPDSRRSLPSINLRQLILVLAGLSVALTLASALVASYRVQRELLIQNTLEANRVYARKLAESADLYLGVASRLLQAQAPGLLADWGDADALERQLVRLRSEFDGFNSVVVVDAASTVVAMTPQVLARHTPLDTVGSRQALRARRVQISPPYRSASGRLVVVVSAPVFAEDGRYLGYVGGSIYLQQNNVLHKLLGQHYYQDGSYLYVVDGQRRVIYHHDPARVGQQVGPNPIIDAVLAGRSGSVQARNSRQVMMLAGFSPLQSADWGLVAQRPLQATLAPLVRLGWKVGAYTLPLLLVTLVLIWWLSRQIALPLWRLARSARDMEQAGSDQAIQGVRAWYFEAAQLKRAILAGLAAMSGTIRRLNIESHTDPLTGLLNRRGMQDVVEGWVADERPFAVILLDLDQFKAINDTFGHDGGDRVLAAFGELLRKTLRPGDVACRSGGEEFAVLLWETGLVQAGQVAERLRRQIAESPLGVEAAITASLGVAQFPSTAEDVAVVLKLADRALYRAKNDGRNRVELAVPADAASTGSARAQRRQ